MSVFEKWRHCNDTASWLGTDNSRSITDNWYSLRNLPYMVILVTSFGGCSKMLPRTRVFHSRKFSGGGTKFSKFNNSSGNCPYPLERGLRDRSIFMGIRDRKICNGTTGYFGPSVGRGHRLFWGLTLRGHRLFQCRISTGSKIILEYSDTGPWIILRLYGSFS